MAYTASADLTAAWYAAAPPPPPPSASPRPNTPSSRPPPARSSDSFSGKTNGIPSSSSSTSSLGFDKRAKGDDFPADSHAPEPERPVSRNAMARVREKERQRARTESSSTPLPQHHHQQGYASTSAQQAPHGIQQDRSYYQHSMPVARERHDSSPASAAPWSTYPQQQYQQQHVQQQGYDYAQSPPVYYQPQQQQQQHAYHQQSNPVQGMYAAPPQSPMHGNPAWQQAMSVAPPAPAGYQMYPAAPAQGAQQSGWMAQPPAQGYQPPVPFPSNAMPPPPSPASLQQQQAGAQYNHYSVIAPSPRPLPSPSRSSSQSSSVGTGASSPSLGSISGTVRRSLPRPPGQPLPRTGTDSQSSLGRHDSVRMAAEEMMARGAPRRKNMSSGSRFGKSDGSIAVTNTAEKLPFNAVQEQGQHSQPRNGGRIARAESASCLEQEMRELELKEEERKHAVGSASIAPIHQPIVRAASPRPVRAAPEPAPQISIVTPVEDVIPRRPLSRGPKDEGGRRGSMASFEGDRKDSVTNPAVATASAAQIPVIFSPPPDTKPAVPMISFDEPPASPGMPSIVLPGDDEGPSIAVHAPGPPTIEVNQPSIHVSSEGSEESEESEGPRQGISISVSSSNVAQRSTTTATSEGVHQSPIRQPAPASASSVGSGASCATCQKWIGGRVVHAMSHTFHPDCFVCCHCSEHLEHVAFYEHEGRPYCHFDYHELFSKRCFHCRTPIVDQRYITINDVDLVGGSAEERCYHDLHFFCANCGDPFLDPKVASSAAGSDPMDMVEDEDGKVRFGGREFVVHKGYPYCEKCHVNLHKPRCKGCKKPILETDFLTALKAKWHIDCFCCQFCHRPISSENFFVKNGEAFDEECYKIKLRSEL